MSNVLFALYHDFSANSAVHVHNFANRLADLGHSTAVAIPEDTDTGSALGMAPLALNLCMLAIALTFAPSVVPAQAEHDVNEPPLPNVPFAHARQLVVLEAG